MKKGGQRKVKREFSFDLDNLKFMNEPKDELKDSLDEDPEKAEVLKGSIFDMSTETPKSGARTPKAAFFRLKTSSSSSPSDQDDEGGNRNSEKGEEGGGDNDHGHDEAEGEKQQGHRRSKAMFQRVGGFLTLGRVSIGRTACSCLTLFALLPIV